MSLTDRFRTIFSRRGTSAPSSSSLQSYDAFKGELVQRFSSPEPESDQLRQLIVRLAGFNTGHLPRDKRRWLELLVESPYLAGPLEVYKDEFSAVGYEILRPRDRGSIANALQANSLPSARRNGRGMARNDLIDDMVAAGSLVPVEPDFPLNKILTQNIRGWTGRRLLAMSAIHYSAVGEAFWSLGTSTNTQQAPDEALTLVPTEVLETPRLPNHDSITHHTISHHSTGYRLRNAVGTVPAETIFEWSRPDPRDIYARGRGIVQVLGDQVEGAEWIDQLIGTNARNNNIPPYMYIYRGEEELIDAERRMDRKHRGRWRKFRMFMQRVTNQIGPVSDEYAVEKLADPLDPAKVTEYSRWVWRFIREYLRVPPSMLGNWEDNSGLGTAGVELERATFLMTAMTSLVLEFEDALRDLARRLYDERLVIRHLPFVQTDREFQLRVADKHSDRFTNDELRALAGKPPLEDKKSGAAYLVKRGLIPVADLAPGNEVLEEAAKSGGRTADSSSSSGLPATQQEVAAMGASVLRDARQRSSGVEKRLRDLERER